MKAKKLEETLEHLPFDTQANFRMALKPFNMTPETFIPRDFENKRFKSNNNIMRNTLVTFQKDYNIRKKFLDSLNKDTIEFSKGYHGISQLRNKKKKDITERLIYEDLMKKYSEKNYEIKDLFIKENLFDSSVLLKKGDYEKVLKLNEDNDEFIHSKEYMKKLDFLIKNEGKKKDTFSFNTALKKQEPERKTESSFYPPNYNLKKNILLLKYDIYKTQKTIDDTINFPNINLTQSNFDNTSYNNIISSTRSNYYVKNKFNTTLDTDFTSRNKTNKKIDIRLTKTDDTNTKENSNDYSKTLTMDEPKPNFIRNAKKKMTQAMKKQLHEEMVKDLSNLYETMKKTNYEECEDEVFYYLKKYDKPLPERLEDLK